MFDSKLSYSYLNMARSSLSTLLPSIDGVKIGDHPIVTRLLKGVRRERPPKCRYSVIWDVNLVLNLFRDWPENCNLPIRKLTLKLVGLLTILTAQRCQSIQSIRVDDIVFTSFVQIKIGKQLKTFDPRKNQPVFKLIRMIKNPNYV